MKEVDETIEFMEKKLQELELRNKASEASKVSEIVKIEKPKEKEIIKTEPDKKLIADIVKLYAKYYERARIETMMYYWELGKRLNKEYGNPKARGEISHSHARASGKFISFADSAKQLIKKLDEIGITICERNISYARNFAIKCPQIQELIKQQDMNWDKVKRKYLTKQKESQPKLAYDSKVFRRWNEVSNGFFKILDQLDFKVIKDGDSRS